MPAHRQQFQGFEQLDANFIYCPNQFFDVCLPNCSRGTIRFVAYLLRRTLGWLDANGNPIDEQITVSHQDIVEQARISKGAIGSVIDEAVDLRLVTCTQAGQAKAKGIAGQSAQYALRWDKTGEYVTDLNAFHGFYASGGNCSPIPNAFFNAVIPFQPLRVIKVVGCVLRYTVGFEGKYGGRRSQAALSLTALQNYANIKDRKTVVKAVQESLDANFIRRVQAGCFHHRSDQQATAAYAPNWLCKADQREIGSKKPPAQHERVKNPTSNGSILPPADRFKNPTSRKTTQKDNSKQQPVAAENCNAFGLLIDVGFDRAIAKKLAQSGGVDEIQQQIDWLPLRNAARNPLGLLRRAIEESWSKPVVVEVVAPPTRGWSQHQNPQDTESDSVHRIRRNSLLALWRELTTDQQHSYWQAAIEQSSSLSARSRLLRQRNLDNPPTEVLTLLASDSHAVSAGESL